MGYCVQYFAYFQGYGIFRKTIIGIFASLLKGDMRYLPDMRYWYPHTSLICPGYQITPGLEVIKLENSLGLKIKRNDWLLADTCPQAANDCALF